MKVGLSKATPRPWRYEELEREIVATDKSWPKRQQRRVVIGTEPAGACGDPDCCPQGEVLVLDQEDAALIVAAVNSFDAAHKLAEAVLAYNKAIQSCANDPKRMASFCTAQGDELDALYFKMVNLAREFQKARSE